MDWDKLRVFYTVAQSKSLTKAGRELNLSQSAVSRQISSLEERLQYPLFHRHARGLHLTEQGNMLFRTVADMESRLKQVQTQIIESTDRPKGPLRITAPSEIGTIWLTSIMREFTTLYPEIEVTLMADDREYDLSKGEADVAIRLYDTTHPDMIQKQLVSLHNSVYASNAYLRENGIPRDLRDLKKHRLILYSEKSQQPFKKVNWLDGMIEKDRKPKSIFKINSIFGMLKAVESDLGVAALPDYMVLHNRNISKILHEVHGPQVDAYIIYPVELRKSKRVKVFRNFVLQKMRDVAF